MEDRLALCAKYLSEVETRLQELQTDESDLVIIEALSFVHLASTVVQQARKDVGRMPEAARHMEPRSGAA